MGEVRRMEEGGNVAWREFWDRHVEGGKGDKSVWDQTSIEDRYKGDVGEEYKERLSAKIEGREYVPPPRTEKKRPLPKVERSSSQASSVRSGSPALVAGGRKQQNEAYFAKLGNENASRPADLPPSQGGKFGGFGSAPMPEPVRGDGGGNMPGVDEFQKDPVAALTKGFGWFTATVGKGAKAVNEGYIQPTAQKVCRTCLALRWRVSLS